MAGSNIKKKKKSSTNSPMLPDSTYTNSEQGGGAAHECMAQVGFPLSQPSIQCYLNLPRKAQVIVIK